MCCRQSTCCIAEARRRWEASSKPASSHFHCCLQFSGWQSSKSESTHMERVCVLVAGGHLEQAISLWLSDQCSDWWIEKMMANGGINIWPLKTGENSLSLIVRSSRLKAELQTIHWNGILFQIVWHWQFNWPHNLNWIHCYYSHLSALITENLINKWCQIHLSCRSNWY